MQIFVINLLRRPDRLASMERRLSALGLPMSRVDAVDARSAELAGLASRFARPGLFGPISQAEQACLLSHFRAYEQFLSTPGAEARAVILEDDVVLSDDAGAVLSVMDGLPGSVGLLKLERERRRVMLGKPRFHVAPGRAVSRLYSDHSCAAGYVISRSAAEKLLELAAIPQLPVDFLLFHELMSPVSRQLRPYQLTPAIVEQADTSHRRDSDIEPTRSALTLVRTKPKGWAKLRREALRIVHQLRHVAAACVADAAWSDVDFQPPV